jgi:hypothetical protein
MSLCIYCRAHNEQSLIDVGEKNYCEDNAIWSEDELKSSGMKIPSNLNGYEVCEHCYNERISKW